MLRLKYQKYCETEIRFMKIVNHLLTSAQWNASPNFDDRPLEQDISLLVIHCISLPPGQFGGNFIDQLFCNQLSPTAHPYFADIAHLKVSAHILIQRDGSITQYVPFNKRAWHAGVSEYKGRQRCNDFSIGIELEGTPTSDYSDAQYHHLNQLIDVLLATYPQLSRERITGHSDIAPDRKADPGPGFNWNRLYNP